MRLSNGEVLLRWPLDQHILTQGWHYNSGRSHNGIDLRTQIGNTAVRPVYAAEDGTVSATQLWDGHTTDERSMQSYGNYVGLTDDANDMFGKVMSIPDELMVKYYRLASTLSVAEIDQLEADLKAEKLHPNKVKRALARNIVAAYHDEAAAEQAEADFDLKFKDHGFPEDAPTFQADLTPGEDGTVYGTVELQKELAKDIPKVKVKVTAFARITKDMQRGAISQEDARKAKDYVRALLYDALRDANISVEAFEQRISSERVYQHCGITRTANPRGRPPKEKAGEQA